MGSVSVWWTDEELGFLQDHEHWAARQVGEALGRRVDSIKHMRRKLRSGEARRKEPWTAEEDEFILATTGLNAREVSERLPGRSKSSVDERRQILGKVHGVSFGGRKKPTEIGTRPLVAKTCGDCGLLLDASWFQLNLSRRFWTRQCLRCRPKEDRAKAAARQRARQAAGLASDCNRKMQEFSLRYAVNKGQPYTEADHAVLADPDLTAIEKAIKLGRTYFSIKTMVSECGYTSAVGRGDPSDAQWLIDAPNAQRLIEEASGGKTARSVEVAA